MKLSQRKICFKKKLMGQYKEYQEKVEAYVLKRFREHEEGYRDWWFDQTGTELPDEIPNWAAKDLYGRYKVWLIDKSFVMNGIDDEVDGSSSGKPAEVKTLYYPIDFFDEHPFILDKKKANTVKGYIWYVIPNMEGGFYWFRFTSKDIKIYGNKGRGGKKDNETKEDSDKVELFTDKRYAEASGVWRKKGRKS